MQTHIYILARTQTRHTNTCTRIHRHATRTRKLSKTCVLKFRRTAARNGSAPDAEDKLFDAVTGGPVPVLVTPVIAHLALEAVANLAVEGLVQRDIPPELLRVESHLFGSEAQLGCQNSVSSPYLRIGSTDRNSLAAKAWALPSTWALSTE